MDATGRQREEGLATEADQGLEEVASSRETPSSRQAQQQAGAAAVGRMAKADAGAAAGAISLGGADTWVEGQTQVDLDRERVVRPFTDTGKNLPYQPALIQSINEDGTFGEARLGDPEQVSLNRAVEIRADDTWDADAILNNLTQLDQAQETTSDEIRCAAHAVLAVFIQSGPQAIPSVAKNTAARLRLSLEKFTAMPTSIKANIQEILPTLDNLPACIAARQLTYRHLQRLAHGLKLAAQLSVDYDAVDQGVGNRQIFSMAEAGNPDEQVSDEVVINSARTPVAEELGGTGFATNYDGVVPANWSEVKDMMDALWPGQAYILDITMGRVAPGTTVANMRYNHAITLGCSDRGVYIYDPYPRQGDQVIYFTSDPDAFKEYFIEPDGTFRHTRFATRMTPPL